MAGWRLLWAVSVMQQVTASSSTRRGPFRWRPQLSWQFCKKVKAEVCPCAQMDGRILSETAGRQC